jgi:hypothetical protein
MRQLVQQSEQETQSLKSPKVSLTSVLVLKQIFEKTEVAHLIQLEFLKNSILFSVFNISAKLFINA